MRIIDAHNHPDWHGYNLEKFLANMAQHGIEKTWLFSWECPLDEFDPTYNNVFLIDSTGLSRSHFPAASSTNSARPTSSCSATRPTRGGPTPSTSWRPPSPSTACSSTAS